MSTIAASTYSLAPSARNSSLRGTAPFRPALPRFRVTWPEMPQTEGFASAAAGFVLRTSAAAIPFVGLGWLFVTR